MGPEDEFPEVQITGRPGTVSKELEVPAQSKVDESRQQKESDRQVTEGRIRQNTDEMIKSKGNLNENQNVNLAKNNPQGNLNSRSFGKTLALSRAADRYNNKPIDYITTMRGGSAVNGLELSQLDPYKRPRIETEETRQMERNRRIDEARQMLRTGLQGKVDQWTYDRMLDMANQLAVLNVSDDQYRNMLNQYTTQSLVQQYITKDLGLFNDMLRRYGITMDAATILKATQNSDTVTAVMAGMFGLGDAPKREDVYTDQGLKKLEKDLVRSGMSPAQASFVAPKLMMASADEALKKTSYRNW